MCISCLLNIILAPNNITWIRLNYVLSTGPLAIASIAWRNSLVFHSLDKVTSTLIHVFPPVLMYNVRWFPIGIDEDHDAKISNYLGFNVSTMLGSTQLSRMCETSDVPKGPGGRIDANMFYFTIMMLRHLALLALHTSKSSTMAFWLMPSGKLVILRSRRFFTLGF